MKNIFTILLSCISVLLYGQTQCVSLAGYNNAYLNTVSINDTTYPAGSAFITSGDIQYLKHDNNDYYQFIMGDTLLYIGDIDIDISTATCPNRTLTFSVVYLEGMAIDGDTIFTSLNPPTSYTGNGFSMTQDGAGHYTVTGNFDMVSLFSSTNLLFDVCLVCNSSNPTQCVSLDAYDNAYLNTVSNDDITYPAGSAFVTSGDIRYLKHDNNDYYQFIMGDTLLYIGDIDIDISTVTCPNRTLTFSVAYLEGMAIDGDTIFTSLNPPTSYTGNGFSMTQDGAGHYTVTGNFDMVSLFSSTNLLFDVCLVCNSSNPTQCVSLDAYDNAYLNTVSNDDITYPAGSAFVTSGDIRYLKHDNNDYYQFIMGDTLLYIGDLDIDISTATCLNRTLTFSVVYLEGMAIDGDTIFTSLNPPTSYTGNGFTMTQDGAGHYTVTGNFDMISLFSSTNLLFDVCLVCNSSNPTQCVSLDAYDNAYLNTISNDDITYPAGSAFITSGDIQYLKHDNNDYYQFIMGDTLLYIGDLDIDISTVTCPNRTLTFSVVYLEGMAIDGDTIFTSLNPPTSYTGNGFSMTQDGAGHYTVTGNFDMVSLFSSTNLLFDVCLVCDTPLDLPIINNTTENQLIAYPNPTNSILNIEVGNINIGNEYYIFDASGRMVSTGRMTESIHQINVFDLNSGLYFIKINNAHYTATKFIKN